MDQVRMTNFLELCRTLVIRSLSGSVYFSPGDIVRLTKGYAVIWRQCLTLYSGKNGDINKLGDFCMLFNEQLNMSEPNPNFGPQQGGGPVGQQQTQQQQQVLNGGTSIMNGNNNGRAGGGAQGTSAFNGNPSSNSNNSTNPPAAATTKATRVSNENKGGASIANTAQKNSRGGRSSNSRSNVK